MIRRRFPAFLRAAALAALLLLAAAACGHRMVEPDASAQLAGPPCGEHAAVERTPVADGVYAYPAEALDPPWLHERRSEQIASAGPTSTCSVTSGSSISLWRAASPSATARWTTRRAPTRPSTTTTATAWPSRTWMATACTTSTS